LFLIEPELTAVICFANEGDEVERTVRGIRDTCGDAVDILLINDASDDDRDYEAVADRHGARYLENSERIGPAHSRHKGLRWAKTDNVIFLDAHMRFYAQNWHQVINDTISCDPEALYCTRSKPLKPGGDWSGAPTGLGASIVMDNQTFGGWLKPDWNIRALGDGPTAYIPCVLGGCYAVRRQFMLHTEGYRGLHRYGGEESLISIKAWLAGGSCQLINDVEIGHIYRGGKPAPWRDTVKYFHFNKLATARIVMTEPEFAAAMELVETVENAKAVKDVFRSRQGFVDQARLGFKKVQQRPLRYFLDLNEAFRSREKIEP